MKALFCVFSGTGNTLRLARALSEKLEEGGAETKLHVIKKGAPMPEIEGFDILLFGYPVHAFNAPVPAIKFLKALPFGGGKRAYLFRTSGEPLKLNDAASVTPRRILKKRGYNVAGEFSYVMPYNIIFRHTEEMASRMDRAASLRTDRDVRDILFGKGALNKVPLWRRFVSFVLRIEHPAMSAIGRGFHTAEDCTGCGLCAKKCPQGNIRMENGKPVFGKSCVGCMACAFYCPNDAVRTGILNGWRVNGVYRFDAPPAADGEVCDYCRKSYLRYFRESEGPLFSQEEPLKEQEQGEETFGSVRK